MENSLTREETLKGMTIWGAYFNFEEHEKGSVEVGKSADFIVFTCFYHAGWPPGASGCVPEPGGQKA